MKVSELRIGNWIKSSMENNLQIRFGSWLETDLIRNGQPIRLTEEWLLKFGFKREDEFSSISLQVNDILWMFGNAHGQVGLTDKRSMEMINVRCEYIHQLQNLYFSLTGKELEFNGKN